MTPAHIANLAVHVSAGSAALAIGFMLLARRKGTATHRRWGRRFCYLTLAVCLSAAIGSLFFRFVPLFAVLTVLVTYQLVSGWRAAYTQADGPAAIDALWTAAAIAFSIGLLPHLSKATGGAHVVVYSSLGALATILLYDLARWAFPRDWHRTTWRYEHGYKLISSIFAMLSALVGNVVRFGQPWSQMLPSAAGVLVIGYFFHRLSVENRIDRQVRTPQ